MRGNNMVLSTFVFFVGFAMAVGGVYFYNRASDTEYARLRLEMNASQNDMARAVKRFDESVDGLAQALSTVRQLADRIAVLEKKNPEVTVQLSQPSKPFLVEVVERAKVPLLKQKDKARRLAQ